MRDIKARLKRLEVMARPVSEIGIPISVRRSLAELLGRKHSLFMSWRYDPVRSGASHWMGEIIKRRQAYREGSGGSALKASGKGSWRIANETRNELVALDLASAIRSGGQILSLTLTPKGERVASRLCGLLQFEETLPVLDLLRSLQAEKSPVSEDRLWGCELSGSWSQWIDWHESLLPGLSYGKIREISNSVGRLFFWIDDEVEDPPQVDLEGIDFDEGSAEAYWQAFKSETQKLNTDLELSESRDLWIPIPASCSL